MFCWGSTIHGELGLGGIEDENIFIPREVDFRKANDIEQSMISKDLKANTLKAIIARKYNKKISLSRLRR